MVEANLTNDRSLVKQEIISYGKDEHTYHKIYANNQLLGVITDLDYINQLINDTYKEYEDDFPDTELGFSNNVNIIEEVSFIDFSNVDDEIMAYLKENNLLGIKTTAVEFSSSDGVYDVIYVKNVEDFKKARDLFLENFVDSSTLEILRNDGEIASPNQLGSVDVKVEVNEKIAYSTAIVSLDEIMKDVNSIYEFLCYGRNKERDYYTVKEGDTLQGVGYYFGDMSAKQLVMLNPGVLFSETQAITAGMKINVTYYTSPITVVVTKENLVQEDIYPEVPEYIVDESLDDDQILPIVDEDSGVKHVLYEEKWINGVLQSGTFKSERIIEEPVRGKVLVGSKVAYMVGTGNYIWPVDNPRITCRYGCYFNHTGTDFINRYNHYGPVYAIDNGVVADTGYKYDMGNYLTIDHKNGIRTFYMHLNTPAYVEIGDNITRGQVVGQIGNTGRSEGAHLHLTFELYGTRIDACEYLPCDLLG